MPLSRDYGSPPPRSYIPDVRQPFYGGNDPYAEARNNRQRTSAYGDMLNQQFQDFGNEEDWYRQVARGQGYDAYGDIGDGNGGYRPGEQTDIIGRGGLDRMQMTPEQRQALFLSEGEEGGIRGDPNKAEGWFDPAGLDTLNTEFNSRIGENVGDSTRNLNNTYDEDGLSLSRGYRDELGNIRSGQAGGVRGALQTGSGNVRGALRSGEAGVRGTINRDRLTIDPNFVKGYRMTDRDVNDITQQAATTQGNIAAGQAGAVQRAAAKAGGMSPLALASGINEITMRGGQQGARAMLEARIAARQMQADRLQNVEGMRLGAEGRYAGLASDAEMGLSGRAANAEMALSGRDSDAEMGLGDRAYGTAADYEGLRLGTERDKGNRRYQIANNIADRSYAGTMAQGQNSRSNAQYRGEQGVALARGTDDRQVARAGEVAGNRQNAERYGQESEYDRAKYGNNALSTRTAGVADARLAQERERRAWLADQQGLANNNVNTAYGNQIKNYGQAGQLANQSTGQTMDYDLGRRGNSFGTNFKKNAGASAGKVIGGNIGAWATGG